MIAFAPTRSQFHVLLFITPQNLRSVFQKQCVCVHAHKPTDTFAQTQIYCERGVCEGRHMPPAAHQTLFTHTHGFTKPQHISQSRLNACSRHSFGRLFVSAQRKFLFTPQHPCAFPCTIFIHSLMQIAQTTFAPSLFLLQNACFVCCYSNQERLKQHAPPPQLLLTQ